jgi:hypothetical protein
VIWLSSLGSGRSVNLRGSSLSAHFLGGVRARIHFHNFLNRRCAPVGDG